MATSTLISDQIITHIFLLISSLDFPSQSPHYTPYSLSLLYSWSISHNLLTILPDNLLTSSFPHNLLASPSILHSLPTRLPFKSLTHYSSSSIYIYVYSHNARSMDNLSVTKGNLLKDINEPLIINNQAGARDVNDFDYNQVSCCWVV